MDFEHYKITVRGKVQGVWFRKYTKDKADELGLKGSVKNQLDGSVYIEAEGSRKMLKVFTEWLRIGSPLSNVTDVRFVIGKQQHFCSFEVKR